MKEAKKRKETAAAMESSSPSLSLDGKGNLLPLNKIGKGVSCAVTLGGDLGNP